MLFFVAYNEAYGAWENPDIALRDFDKGLAIYSDEKRQALVPREEIEAAVLEMTVTAPDIVEERSGG